METETEQDFNPEPVNLLTIPQCVLRILLSYLDSTTLYFLSQTCTYLKDCVEDPIFWKYIDARHDPITNEKLAYCTERVHDKTTHLFLRFLKHTKQLPNSFFRGIAKFDNISVLALENQPVNGAKVSLKDFPPGLQELSLKKSRVKCSVYFFQYSAQRMKNLRVLIIDECRWVTCSFLLSVSKFENLEIISAVKCLRVHLNMVPYLNVAKYGCKKLKIMDFRFTGLGGELLRTFYSKPSLQNLYFQSFVSAETDYNEKIKFGHSDCLSATETGTDLRITDASLSDYLMTLSMKSIEPIKPSLLYNDPYPECTCGYDDPLKQKIPFNGEMVNSDNVYITSGYQATRFVCRRHMRDAEDLPKNIKDFFLRNRQQFLTDIISDGEASDSSETDDEHTCCIYSIGNRTNRSNNEDFDVLDHERPPGAYNEVPFNIVIVRMAGSDCASRTPSPTEDPQPSTSKASEPSAGSSTQNTHKRKESDNNDHGDSSDDDSKNNKRQKIYDENDQGPSTSKNSDTNKRKVIDDNDDNKSDTCKKSKTIPDGDKEDNDNKDDKKEPPAGDGGKKDEKTDKLAGLDEFMKSTDTFYDRLNNAIEHSIATMRVRPIEHSQPAKPNSVNVSVGTDDDLPPRSTSINKNQSDGAVAGPSSSRGKSRNYKRKKGKQPTVKPRPNTVDVGTSSDGHNPTVSPDQQADHHRDERNPGPSRNNDDGPNNVDNNIRNIDERNREQAGQYPRCVRIFGPGGPELPKKDISLKRLSLRGYKKITDVTLRFLQNLDLELLDLTYTSVSKKGIEDYLLLNPSCRIIHPEYCVCKPTNPF